MADFLKAEWSQLIMANYAVNPGVLSGYLPKGVEVDLFHGVAYLSLVGFLFKKTRIFGIPVPVFGTFEEVNLRFYVVRKMENENRRGVVFIRETVPNSVVARMANLLYKEHYTAVPTRHSWKLGTNERNIQYDWKINGRWNSISVWANLEQRAMPPGSTEEFIFEHYYGYTKIDNEVTEEYNIHHSRWTTFEVINHQIDCDFSANYGKDFGFLQSQSPESVMLAEGSPISVKWKRSRI